ncbi:MAG: hypothetical protein ABH827_05550 [bacterium]
MKNVKKMLLGLVLGFMLLGNAGAMQGAGPAAAQNQQNVVQPPFPLMPAINQLTQAIERRGPLVILTINERFKKDVSLLVKTVCVGVLTFGALGLYKYLHKSK